MRTSEPALVEALGNKVLLERHAASLGLLRHLPRHYATAAVAEYPCVLKAAEGQFGKGVHIVRDAAEVRSP